MKNPRLIDGLMMLEKVEWISFRKYIMMYCTKASDNYKLLEHLFSARNKLGEWSEIEEIKNPLFQKMTDKNFSNLMSRIFIWFEEWLVWYENKKDGTACDIQLVKIYNRKGVFNLADKTYRRVEQKLLSNTQLDLRKHRDLYQLHHYHYFSDNPVKYKRHGEILETLVSYFLLQFKEQGLLYISELHNWGDLQNYDYTVEIELLTQIGFLVADTQTSKVIELIKVMVSELNEKAFLDLRDVIFSKQINPDSELYVFASLYMITFSLRLWNNNKISNSQLVLEVYDFGLESGVLLNTGKIPFIRFINLVDTLGYIKSSQKNYVFVDKWKHLVGNESKEAIQALGYAQLKFSEEKYEEIIPLLLGMKFNTEWGRVRSSCLELIGLYSDRKNNYSILINRISNFKRVLKTYGSKSSNLTHRSFLNFTKVIELLAKRDFIKRTIKIENYSPIMYKSWLINEIKAGQQ